MCFFSHSFDFSGSSQLRVIWTLVNIAFQPLWKLQTFLKSLQGISPEMPHPQVGGPGDLFDLFPPFPFVQVLPTWLFSSSSPNFYKRISTLIFFNCFKFSNISLFSLGLPFWDLFCQCVQIFELKTLFS